jgi:hypothetical protein
VAKRKNPHAVALGRRGGLKGGKARAEKLTATQISEISSVAGKARMDALTPTERQEIARKAATKRWAGHEAKRPGAKRKTAPKKS